MSERDRICQRAGCRQAARVTLAFRYDARQASLVDLQVDKDPAHYDLCVDHADILIVPRGWERLDRRTPRPQPATAIRSAAQPGVGAVGHDVGDGQDHLGSAAFDRYATLTAQLPRLAEAFKLTVSGGDGTGAQPYEPVTGRSTAEQDVLEGQLQMPIEPQSDGVVIALTRVRQH